MLKNVFALLIAATSLSSCTYEKAEDPKPIPEVCDTTAVTFTNTLKPLFIAKCSTDNSSCHQDENSTSGIPLLDYAAVSGQVDIGSLLFSVTHEGGLEPMPQNGDKLDDCSINKIRAWINQGMVE